MGNSNGVIGNPISLHADVYPVLGISKSGTYYDVGYACRNTHGKINKWSYYKPTPYPSVSLTTQAQMKEAFSSVNYGLTWTKFSTALSLISTVDEGTETWGYQPPTGGSSSPYRLTDFLGYNHRAVSPFNTAFGTTSGKITDVTMGITYNKDDPFLPVGISSYYWAMTFKKPDGNYKTYISSATVGNSQGYTKDGLSSSLLGTGMSLCYFYLVPTKGYNTNIYNEDNLHTYDWSGYGSIIPFPTENNRMEVSYTTADVLTWTLIANTVTSSMINWTLTIANPTSSAVTVVVTSASGTYGTSSGGVTMDYTNAIGTQTIAANSNFKLTRSYSADGMDGFSLSLVYNIDGSSFTRVLSV